MYLNDYVKSECCGCDACVVICPKHCIQMLPDKTDGHLYPTVDANICINCRLCEKVCPMASPSFHAPFPSEAYLFVGSNEEVCRSASGGAFGTIAAKFIKDGGIVYGAKFNDELKVIHGSAHNMEELNCLRKSKYIQSDISQTFSNISDQLKSNINVLFSGVPCQVAALTKFLVNKHIDLDNLITISLLCHGVPSQDLFDRYKTEHERNVNSRICKYTFKNKIPYKGSVNSRTALIEYSNGKKAVVGTDKDAFLRMYYNRLGYRPSCANCPFATEERVADITLADAWNIETVYPEYDSLKGVSLILTSSAKGHSLVKSSLGNCDNLKSINYEWAISSQSIFHRPTEIHPKNDEFLHLIPKIGFNKAVFRTTREITVKKVTAYAIWRIKKMINRK